MPTISAGCSTTPKTDASPRPVPRTSALQHASQLSAVERSTWPSIRQFRHSHQGDRRRVAGEASGGQCAGHKKAGIDVQWATVAGTGPERDELSRPPRSPEIRNPLWCPFHRIGEGRVMALVHDQRRATERFEMHDVADEDRMVAAIMTRGDVGSDRGARRRQARGCDLCARNPGRCRPPVRRRSGCSAAPGPWPGC